MLKRLLLLGLILFSTNLFAQCPTGDVTLASQADVDNFAVLYPDCSELNGRINIGGSGGPEDITDLTPLMGLTKILGTNGDLSITNCPLLNSLDGLNSLTEIEGQISISGVGLTNVDPLNSLEKVLLIRIRQNPVLENLNGFQGVDTEVGSLEIVDNPLLASIEGFSGITKVSFTVELFNNPSLTSLAGLDGLVDVPNCEILIREINALEDLNGLQNLKHVKQLRLENNNLLSNTSGLSNLISGTLVFDNNDALVSITGLDNYIGGGESGFALIDNDILTNVSPLIAAREFDLVSFTNNPLLGALPGFSGAEVQQLYIGDNASLTSLAGIEGVFGFNDGLRIVGNASLIDINALADTWIAPFADFLWIVDNPLLSECTVNSVCAFIRSGGTVSILDNAIGCNSPEEVEAGCASCPTDTSPLVLSTQAEVDNFALLYPDCSMIPSSLTISGPDITDLTPLSGLTAVTGGIGQSLKIEECPLLTSLEGLNNLTTVYSALVINNNPQLTNIEALSNLSSLESFFISENDILQNLNGLEGVTHSGGQIFNMPQLTSIEGLSGLNYINTSFVLAVCPNLLSLNGLEGLEYIPDANITIAECSSITSLSGLQNLSNVSRLSISSNAALTDISALQNLQYFDLSLTFRQNDALTAITDIENVVGGANANISIADNANLTSVVSFNSLTSLRRITIDSNPLLAELPDFGTPTILELNVLNNDLLTNLVGLNDLNVQNSIVLNDNLMLSDISAFNTVDFSGVNTFEVQNNASLSSCDETAICDFLAGGNTIAFSTNAVGCNSQFEVEFQCTGVPTGDVALSSQAEVDTFFTICSDCTDLPGSLTISGADITDLTPLNGISSINGALVILNNPLLTNLDGLETLTTIPIGAGDLAIVDNPLLANIQGLNGLTGPVGININIQNNPSLIDLQGLENVTGPGDDDIIIINNDLLVDMTGLNGAVQADDIVINDNENFVNLNGLDLFESTGDIIMRNNPSLLNLDGMPQLVQIFGLVLTDNVSLQNLNGLGDALYNAGAGMEVTGNLSLDTCNAPMICEYLAVADPADTILIENNAPGCDSREEVEASCAVCPTGEINLLSQAEVDAFPDLYPFCSQVDQLIRIGGADITDLTPLSQITSMTDGADFRIYDNPNLTILNGLENLLSIDGTLLLQENDILTDISALSNLETIGAFLVIEDNAALDQLDGLVGLTSLASIFILNNPDLTNIEGLQNIVSNTGRIEIGNNDSLIDLDGLQGISSIDNNELNIFNNQALLNLSGLENLSEVDFISISGNSSLVNTSALSSLLIFNGISVSGNASLVNFTGLENAVGGTAMTIDFTNNALLESVGSFNVPLDIEIFSIQENPNLNSLPDLADSSVLDIRIRENSSLSTLSGIEEFQNTERIVLNLNQDLNDISVFEDFDFDLVIDLSIQGNTSLSNCDALALCLYLGADGVATISTNAPGCNSREEVESACAPCPSGVELFLGSQAEVDAFPITYPSCVSLPINLTINGPDITDLSPLSGIDFISGDLVILGNPLLESLAGLDGLTAATGIGGAPFLNVEIRNNAILNDISAINDFDANAVIELLILNNPELAVCNNEFVCNYLDIGLAPDISGNAAGCESIPVVEEACGLGVTEFQLQQISLYPNPANDVVNIQLLDGLLLQRVELYNVIGQKVSSSESVDLQVADLAAGLYFVKIITSEGTVLKRLIKQ